MRPYRAPALFPRELHPGCCSIQPFDGQIETSLVADSVIGHGLGLGLVGQGLWMQEDGIEGSQVGECGSSSSRGTVYASPYITVSLSGLTPRQSRCLRRGGKEQSPRIGHCDDIFSTGGGCFGAFCTRQ